MLRLALYVMYRKFSHLFFPLKFTDTTTIAAAAGGSVGGVIIIIAVSVGVGVGGYMLYKTKKSKGMYILTRTFLE